jgi:HEAT repeat protein
LGELKAQNAVTLLLDFLRDYSWFVRRQTALALGMIGNPISIPRLIERLYDDYPEVRGAIAISLGMLEAYEAVEALIPLLDDDAVQINGLSVAENAANALLALGVNPNDYR